MSRIYRWNGSSWVNVPDGTAFRYWNGSSWVNPQTVRYWNGSSWVTAWNKSDPVTYTYYAWFTGNLRHGTSNAWTTTSDNDDVYIGAFAGTYPYHFGGVVSIGDSTDGDPGKAANVVIQTRPVIKSISLRITRQGDAGNSAPSGNMYIGTLGQPTFWGRTGTMSTVSSYFDWSPVTTYSVSGWGFNQERTISIEAQHGYDMINSSYGLLLSGVTSGYTTAVGSNSGNYMKFHGADESTSLRPMFTVTFDYV